VYGSSPFAGKLADSIRPRVPLALSFFLLLFGYLGIKGIYDASKGSTEPAGNRTLFTLMLFELISGIGGDTGYSAALNTVAKSFPDKIVSSQLSRLDLLTSIKLTHFLWCSDRR
jgi:hypothetical protein